MSADLVMSQLEQNEDILAAIVENLQLGRLNDCMQHYAILQANLVALANDLDNYPAEETDPYSTLNVFPDEIMRRDVLEDLLPVGTKALPKPPVVPACADCLSKKIEASVCRGSLRHVEPNGRYSATEREEFYNCTQVLAARYQDSDQDPLVKKQRPYKVWSKTEKYTLVVGIRIFGTNYPRLMRLLPERGEGQIRSFITKNLKDGEKWKAELENCSVTQLMDQRPAGYQPPPMLTEFFAAHAAGRNPMDIQWERTTPLGDIDLAATTSTESLLSPEAGRPDFNLLLTIAAGVGTHSSEDVSTRVPSSPPPGSAMSTNTDYKPIEGFAVYTEVGQGSGGLLVGDAGDSLDEAPLMLACNNKALNLQATAPNLLLPPPAAQHGQPAAKESSRRVRWDTTVADTAFAAGEVANSDGNTFLQAADPVRSSPRKPAVNSSAQNQENGAPYPVQRDLTVTGNMAPPASAAPPLQRDPLKDLLSAAQHQEIKQHQQQMESQFVAEQERNKREESALAGLASYNLEYARTLQAANIPFKMTTQSGTVVVVKSNGNAAPAASVTAPNGGNKPPPFALPGMQRMKQEQKRRKDLEDTAAKRAPVTSSQPRQEVLSIPLESFTAKLDAAQQPRLLAQMLAQSQAQAQVEAQSQLAQRPSHHGDASAPSSSTGAGLLDTSTLLRQPIHNSLPTVTAGSYPPPQPRTTSTSSSSSSSSRLSSLGVIVPAHRSNSDIPQEGSLLSRILNGAKASSTPRATSSCGAPNSAKISKPRGGKRSVSGEPVCGPSDSAGGAQSQSHPQPSSLAFQSAAALEVSLSGYEEEDAHMQPPQREFIFAQYHASPVSTHGESSRGRVPLPPDELSVLPEFGCEFSFL